MKKQTILVTGAGSFCAINIIKSLKSTKKYRVISTDIFPHSVGVFRSDAGYLVPREGDDEKFTTKLLEICKKENVSLLIPGFDSEIPYIFRKQDLFVKAGVKVLVGNKLLVEIGNDKYKLYKFLKENNFPYLKSFNISEKDIALKELPFPLVVKPKSAWGQRDFHLISNHNEFDYVLNSIKIDDDFMIQEYLGDLEGEFTNSVSVALDKDILGCICSKRELVKGESRIIVIDEYPELRDQMIKIAKKIGSPGPINLQCRLKDKKAYVFEINPRFSTTNSVRAACGYNEVELLVDHFLTGEKKYIHHYEKMVALAYIDYVYLHPETINEFKKNAYTKRKALIHNWL